MSSMTQWESLLGLPLTDALLRARAAGVEPVVRETCAPRRNEAGAGEKTMRVIRVDEEAQRVTLTVAAFMDGDPRR